MSGDGKENKYHHRPLVSLDCIKHCFGIHSENALPTKCRCNRWTCLLNDAQFCGAIWRLKPRMFESKSFLMDAQSYYSCSRHQYNVVFRSTHFVIFVDSYLKWTANNKAVVETAICFNCIHQASLPLPQHCDVFSDLSHWLSFDKSPLGYFVLFVADCEKGRSQYSVLFCRRTRVPYFLSLL